MSKRGNAMKPRFNGEWLADVARVLEYNPEVTVNALASKIGFNRATARRYLAKVGRDNRGAGIVDVDDYDATASLHESLQLVQLKKRALLAKMKGGQLVRTGEIKELVGAENALLKNDHQEDVTTKEFYAQLAERIPPKGESFEMRKMREKAEVEKLGMAGDLGAKAYREELFSGAEDLVDELERNEDLEGSAFETEEV